MGGHSYSSFNAEHSRSVNHTYTNSIEQNFKQMVEKKVHASMRSQDISLREARDSNINPISFPVILGMDMTASMGMIPQNLIQEGLPKIVSKVIQGGIQSPAILFLGIGDHEVDKYPLQIGQFESGDEEMDLWLKRVYIEQGGGSNEGESYSLAHYFAARHVITDAWEKRKQKGVLITIGDEPNLKTYPTRAIKEIMGNQQVEGFTDKDMLAEVSEKWNVFHINPKASQSVSWRDAKGYWTEFIGQQYVGTDDYADVPNIISQIILNASNNIDIVAPKEDNLIGGAQSSSEEVL